MKEKKEEILQLSDEDLEQAAGGVDYSKVHHSGRGYSVSTTFFSLERDEQEEKRISLLKAGCRVHRQHTK